MDFQTPEEDACYHMLQQVLGNYAHVHQVGWHALCATGVHVLSDLCFQLHWQGMSVRALTRVVYLLSADKSNGPVPTFFVS